MYMSQHTNLTIRHLKLCHISIFTNIAPTANENKSIKSICSYINLKKFERTKGKFKRNIK